MLFSLHTTGKNDGAYRLCTHSILLYPNGQYKVPTNTYRNHYTFVIDFYIIPTFPLFGIL
jgi:hypothetical protein